ncbi:isochorismate synthase MenF [uncultured Actinomyces sp.]|uniref:isochorismate synthase n=1 Tax=uncultured Actinomyces sp. TaxID=249061 RepID=UPI002627F66C|nr:isochorismate synthase [uncultured Actinomyces sp.]
MPSRHFSTIPTLYCWVDLIDPSSEYGRAPIFSLLPSSEVCAWIRDEAMVGLGKAWAWKRGKDRPPLVEAGENAAITEAARVWDLLREKAQVHWGEGARDAWGKNLPTLPFAFVSCAFEDDGERTIIVPELTIITSGSQRFVIAASTDSRVKPEFAPPLRQHTLPARLECGPGAMGEEQWRKAVDEVIDALRNEEAAKVVMARDLTISSDSEINEAALVESLHERYPQTWTFAVDGLIGATPEMLVSLKDGHLHSRVLAGSCLPEDAEKLPLSLKDRSEHLFALESVVAALLPVAQDVRAPARPEVLVLPNIAHLCSDVDASFPEGSVLDAVAQLHPTAAVCGTPLDDALDLIHAHERIERGRYSGPVGWIDGAGNGEFGIALRCGQLEDHGRTLRVFAGCGIMPDSLSSSEFEETQTKMRPILEVLGV